MTKPTDPPHDPRHADARPGSSQRWSHRSYRQERHGNWGSGAARAAVFGVSDGLVSNLSLVAAVAGAEWSREHVLVSGLAGLVAGALSMAAGEYVSVRANRDLLAAELEVERREIAEDPDGERRELAGIYVDRGLDRDTAMMVASSMMTNEALALEAHARDELGIDPSDLGSPLLAAGSSFVAFSFGAALPVLPWLGADGRSAVAVSLLVGLVAALAIGAGLANAARLPRWRGALRQAGLLFLAFVATTAIGSAVGGIVG